MKYFDLQYLERSAVEDIFSGEFYPPDDPDGTAHRLSRLIVGVVCKGVGHETDGSIVHSYNPSWAENTEAIVRRSIGPNSELVGLTLRSNHSRRGATARKFEIITDNSNFPEPRERTLKIINEASKIMEVLGLKIDGDFPGNQAAVTEIAQDFYNLHGSKMVAVNHDQL